MPKLLNNLHVCAWYLVRLHRDRKQSKRHRLFCVRKSHSQSGTDKISESRICCTQNFCSRNLLLSSQQSVKVRDTCSICYPPLCETGGNYLYIGWKVGVLKDWWPPSWSHHPVKSVSHPAWLIGGFCQFSVGRKSGLHPVILIGASLMTLVCTVVLQSLCTVPQAPFTSGINMLFVTRQQNYFFMSSFYDWELM